jgi:hypothetical protein
MVYIRILATGYWGNPVGKNQNVVSYKTEQQQKNQVLFEPNKNILYTRK